MRSGIGRTTPDPFKVSADTLAWLEKNPGSRVQVSPALVPGESTAVILSCGQSTSVNSVIGSYSVVNTTKNQNFNVLSGGLYQSTETMLGTGSQYSCWLPRLADKLITAGSYARVISVPFAFGGTAVSQWLPGTGKYNELIGVAAARVAAAGLTPTMLLWEQGETDSLNAVSQAAYQADLTTVIGAMRSAGISCPIFVRISAYHNLATSGAIADIRAAQTAVVSAIGAGGGVYTGADTDDITDRDVETGVHFTPTGADTQATRWKTVISSHFGV